MKEIIKISLVTAIAIGTLTTTATAQPIKEALDNVDLSGNLRYRYTNGEANLVEKNQYRLEFVINSKLNDMISAKVASSVTGTTTGDDADPAMTALREANFIFNIKGNTIIAGKQALATLFASGELEDQQGTGVVALIPTSLATIAAGLY